MLETDKEPWLLEDMKPHLRRAWRALTLRPMTVNTGGGPRRDRLDHALMNLYVESFRSAPYTLGHWVAYSHIALLVALAVAAYL